MAAEVTDAREAVARLRGKEVHNSQPYDALHIGHPEGVYVALDRHGFPALFVPAEDRRPSIHMRTETLVLRLGFECSLHVAGSTISGRFHVLECKSAESSDSDVFVLLVDALLSRLSRTSERRQELTTFFRTLRRLFKIVPEQEPESERQGLWGELFLMRSLGGISLWATFWHTEPRKRFDLSASRERIEVKTTRGSSRAHSFSHRQLSPVGDEQIVVASLMLQASPEGLNLRELIEQARGDLVSEPAQLAKLETAARSAGMGDSSVPGPSFNTEAAAASLAWFWADEIPTFTQPEPPSVSNTRYTVDLSYAPQVSGVELDDWLMGWRKQAKAS